MSAWEIETGAHVAKFSTEAPIVYSLLCATPTAAPASERGGAPVVLYSGDVNYIVKEWELHQRDGRRWVEPAGHLAGHTDVINCMAAAARGAVLLSASSDGTVGVWDVESRTSVGALGGCHFYEAEQAGGGGEAVDGRPWKATRGRVPTAARPATPAHGYRLRLYWHW